MDSTPARTESGPGARRPLLILALAVFLLHALVTGGHLMSPDEELLYRMSEGIAFKGSTRVTPLEGDPVTGYVPEEFAAHTFATRPGREPGAFYAQYLPLQPLLGVPFLYAARIVEGALAPGFAVYLPDTMTVRYLKPFPEDEFARQAFRRGFLVLLFNPLVAAFSAVVLGRMGKLLTGSRRAGLLAGGLWAFATIAWPHSRTFFTEPLAGLLALLAFEQLIRWQMKPLGAGRTHALLMGLFLGLANWTRVDSPFFTVGAIAAMLGLAVWRKVDNDAWARGRESFPWMDIFLSGAIAFGFWLALQTFNTLRFGGGDITAGYGHQAEGVAFATPLLVGLHGLLFTPGKGMFFFSPALLLGVWGWFCLPRHLRWLGFAGIVMFLPFFLAMATWQNWDGGWCWGPRHIVQIHLPLMLGAAFLFAGTIPWRRWAALILIGTAGAGVQVFGSSQNPLDYYQEYFLRIDNAEYFQVNLRDMQAATIAQEFAILRRDERGQPTGRTAAPSELPAPMIDSIYLPQHTQWVGYRRMWRLGYCDLYFWNRVVRREPPIHWSERD